MEPVRLVEDNVYGRWELYAGEHRAVTFEPAADPTGQPWRVSASVDGVAIGGVADVDTTPMGPGAHSITYTLIDAIGRQRILETTREYLDVAIYRDIGGAGLSFGCADTSSGAVLSMHGSLLSSRWDSLPWASVRLSYVGPNGPTAIDVGPGEENVEVLGTDGGATGFAWQSLPLHRYDEGRANPVQWDSWAPATCSDFQNGLVATIFGGYSDSHGLNSLFDTPDIQIASDGSGGFNVLWPDPDTTRIAPPPPNIATGTMPSSATNPCNCRLVHEQPKPAEAQQDVAFQARFAAAEVGDGFAFSMSADGHAAAARTEDAAEDTFTIVCGTKTCAECCPKPKITLTALLDVNTAECAVSSLTGASAGADVENIETDGPIEAILANGCGAGAAKFTYATGYKLGGKLDGKITSKGAEGGAEVSGSYDAKTTYSGSATKNSPTPGATEEPKGSANLCTTSQKRRSRGWVSAQGEHNWFWVNEYGRSSIRQGKNVITKWELSCN
jgi:hypothetical protein